MLNLKDVNSLNVQKSQQGEDGSTERCIKRENGKVIFITFYLWYVRCSSQKLNSMTRESARHVIE